MGSQREWTIEGQTFTAKDLQDKIDNQEVRIRGIENLKWWLIGAIAVATFVVQFLDISLFHK